MQINAEHYFNASIERIHQARRLYRAGDSYAFSMYASGLAVECILRAFRWRGQCQAIGRAAAALPQFLHHEAQAAKGVGRALFEQQRDRFVTVGRSVGNALCGVPLRGVPHTPRQIRQVAQCGRQEGKPHARAAVA